MEFCQFYFFPVVTAILAIPFIIKNIWNWNGFGIFNLLIYYSVVGYMNGYLTFGLI